jgi:methionyl-tRNA formyltransferase
MTKKLNIVFMGTPQFAVPTLEALHESAYTVLCVVTQPDRRAGRGKKVVQSPVKQTALALGYDILQPESIKTEAFADSMTSLAPDVLVVVAFGQILPESVLSIPPLGAVNVHASLLPKYRGAAPIQWAIINNESETGVTTMLMDRGCDTGNILLQQKTAITPEDTSTTLHDRLSVMGGKLLVETLDALKDECLAPECQTQSLACYAPMLKKKDGRIDWHKTSKDIDAFIRGMTPWPGAFTFFGKKRLKIFKVAPARADRKTTPGAVVKGFQEELRVATGDGAVSILEIQGESGKRLQIADFLRGCEIPEGTLLE